jgi:hypothetical protein
MRCPSCDATIQDREAAFCPRCGGALGAVEGEVTTELRGDELGHDGSTERLTRRESTDPAVDDAPSAITSPGGPGRFSDLAASVGRSAASAGWTDAGTVALFGFLTAVALGSLLVMGAKFQYPSVGTGASAFSGLEVIVMSGLAVLGAPVGIGGLTLSALPMGALALVGWAIVWATKRRSADAGPGDARTAVVAGAKSGAPLALICLVAALLFRIPADPSPIEVNAFAAFLVGGVWGTLFGGFGGWLAAVDFGTRVRAVASKLADRSRLVYEGIVAGVLMLTTTFVFAAAFALLWVIYVLARGPEGFGWGEAFAALIYMVSFAPNVVISVIAIALGAPVEVGAQVTVDGRVAGPLTDVSLFSDHLPWFAFVLLAIPLIACFVGGYSARRTTRISGQGVGVLGLAALLFAFVLADLAVLADARLGAGLVRSRGFALIAPNPAFVFVLALAWAAVVGFVGWWYAERFLSRFPGAYGGTSAPEKRIDIGTSA